MVVPAHLTNPHTYNYNCSAPRINYKNKLSSSSVGCTTTSAIGCNSTTPLPWGVNGTVSAFESSKFRTQALTLIDRHDPSTPFFLNLDFHIAHEPIELPRVHFERQRALTAASGVGDFLHRRTTYQGMVNFLDGVIGNITAKLKAKGMWDDTLYVHTRARTHPSIQARTQTPSYSSTHTDTHRHTQTHTHTHTHIHTHAHSPPPLLPEGAASTSCCVGALTILWGSV